MGYYLSAGYHHDWGIYFTMDGFQPAVAYNQTDDQFLLVAMDDPNHDGKYQIWGKIISGDAQHNGNPFRIFQWANRAFWTPRVAWNSVRNEYLVVWNAIDTTTGQFNDIAAARVSPSGDVLPGAPHIITEGNLPHQAQVAYNPAVDEYLVVWRQKKSAGTDFDIWAARLRGSDAGLVSKFAVNTNPEDQRYPAVAANQQGAYRVVWEQAALGPCCDWDVLVQALNKQGGLVGWDYNVVASEYNETRPQVAAWPGSQSDFLAVWQRETTMGSEIWAEHWSKGLPFLPHHYFKVTGAASWDYANPAVAIAGPTAMFVYEGDSQVDPNVLRSIYGRAWTPNALFLPAINRK